VPPRHEPWVDALGRRQEPLGDDSPGPASTGLYARLAATDLALLEQRIAESGEETIVSLWESAEPHHRLRLAVLLSVYFQLPEALEKTGLISDMPPEDVHAMARGPLAAGGDLYIADLVLVALERAGLTVSEGATMLDFGCSSGRVLRVLGALRPDLGLLGCDPNGGAIAWASEHLPMGRFFVSPIDPPLDLADRSLDVAYAISIWSHFAERPALRWLAEMHRLIRPGGALLITTHGLDGVAWLARGGHMTPESAGDVAEHLIAGNHYFLDVLGAEGDWGVKDEGWGNSYLTMDWLSYNATPDWAIRLVRPAALGRVQDVIVLERRP
jgi:SAM-dependent methyltransferase